MVDREFLFGQSVSMFSDQFSSASWNIEGFTDAKLAIMENRMVQWQIGILYIQEVYCEDSDYFVTPSGFFVIFSGNDANSNRNTVVRFIISSNCRSSVLGFCQFSSRICGLKIKIEGRKLGLISAYTLHNGYAFEARHNFFSELDSFYASISCNGGVMIIGDLNARLYTRLPGEESYIGPYFFKNQFKECNSKMNRFLLIELCCKYDLQIANSYFSKTPEDTVTYFDIGYTAID